MLLHVNPRGSLPTKSPEKNRSSPLKLELNACQESSHNFYIGTNNTQHLERELLSSKFHSIFLHNWLKYLDERRKSQVSTIRQQYQLIQFCLHPLSLLSHFQVYQSTGGKLFAHKMTLHDQRQRGAHCYTIQPSLHPLTHCGGPAGPQLGVMNRRMDVRGRRGGVVGRRKWWKVQVHCLLLRVQQIRVLMAYLRLQCVYDQHWESVLHSIHAHMPDLHWLLVKTFIHM